MSGDSDDIFGFLNETALRLRSCLIQSDDVKQKYASILSHLLKNNQSSLRQYPIKGGVRKVV